MIEEIGDFTGGEETGDREKWSQQMERWRQRGREGLGSRRLSAETMITICPFPGGKVEATQQVCMFCSAAFGHYRKTLSLVSPMCLGRFCVCCWEESGEPWGIGWQSKLPIPSRVRHIEEMCVYIVQGSLVQSWGVQGTAETLSYSTVVGSTAQERTLHRSLGGWFCLPGG